MSAPPRRILGVDPGLTVTGWGVVEERAGGCAHIAHGAVRTRAGDALADRLLAIREGVRAAVRAWAVTSAAVERSFVGNNASSALLLGHARAAAILALAEEGIRLAEYSPTLVKQTVAGYGHGEKGQVALMVRLQLGLDRNPAPADAADALAVALTHWAHARFEETAGPL